MNGILVYIVSTSSVLVVSVSPMMMIMRGCGLMIMQVSSCKINAVVEEEEVVGGGGSSVSASGGILPHDWESSERGEMLSISQLIGFSLMSYNN